MVNPSEIWSSPHLPTLPAVAVELVSLSKKPTLNVNEVVAVVRKDPAICAKILKSTNSSFFGLRTKVTSIERAIPILGTTAITSLALSFSLSQSAVEKGEMREHYQNYWMQSVIQAVANELLSQKFQLGVPSEYFLTGLLADLGRLAMLKAIPQLYQNILHVSGSDQVPLRELELELLGFDHVEIGSKLMENWALPQALFTATLSHHMEPEELFEFGLELTEEDRSLCHATALATAFGEYFCSNQQGPMLQRLRDLAKLCFKKDEAVVDQLIQEVKAGTEEVATLFSINTANLSSPEDLLAEANEQLAQLAMKEHAATTQAIAKQKVIEEEKQRLQSQNQELQQQVLRDGLTGTYNRSFFDDSLDRELERCRRSSLPIGVIFADIDKFKNLNDTYGHQFGDRVLQQVAHTVQESLRRSDILARYGGEEFVVLLLQPTEKGVEKVAERIRERVEALHIESDSKRVPVTISVGASMLIPPRTLTDEAKQLVAEADEAMYSSKRNGRNQVTMRVLMSDQDRNILRDTTQHRFSRWLVQHGLLDVPTVSAVLLEITPPSERIGELARRLRFLTLEQVQTILEEQVEKGPRFGQIAMERGWLDERQLSQLLALQQEDPERLAEELVMRKYISAAQLQPLLTEYQESLAPSEPEESSLTLG